MFLFVVNRYTMPMLLVLLLVGSLAMAQAPVISNRPADPAEAGYRPADGATVTMNPPSLVWVHEPKAASYSVEWARTPDFKKVESADGLPFNTYTHNRTLSPGTYYWRYRYKTKAGEESNWSAVRTFGNGTPWTRRIAARTCASTRI